MEQFEPQYTPVLTSFAEVDRLAPTIETGSKRARRGTTINDQDAGVIHPEATDSHPPDQSAPQRSKRKRTTQRPSIPARKVS